MNDNTIKCDKPEKILYITLNLVMITLISGCILAIINYFTQPIRIQNEEKAKLEARRLVLPRAEMFENLRDQHDWFIGKLANGSIIGYVILIKQKGFDGTIQMVAGVDTKFQIVDYKILSDKETPGLGAKAKEDWFRTRFKGKNENELEISKNQELGKIQAITGATITSRAISNGLKRELLKLKNMVKHNE